ncbi:MAG: hypothetical protein CSB34_02725 [Desulfobulbus propionicus]|nr:MAG: hypothetical protein CSB34_02725 [Desulfobulbus propionicus]
MIKRYLLTILAFLGLVVLYSLTFIPLALVSSGLSQQKHLLSFGIWGAMVLISLFPALAVIIGKIWFFKGKGEPVTRARLQETLMQINAANGPVQIMEKKRKHLVTWKHQEKLWCELMSRNGMTQLYELHLFFDDATKTVELIDKMRKVGFVDCPDRVKKGFLARPKPLLRVGLGEQWGVENYQKRQPHEYNFKPVEIKSPVMGTILKNGWNVRFRLL